MFCVVKHFLRPVHSVLKTREDIPLLLKVYPVMSTLGMGTHSRLFKDVNAIFRGRI